MGTKKFFFCQYCPKRYELTFSMKLWTGMKCENCGEYFVISEQTTYTEQELLETQNV
jgi:predicted ATP-dependent serine protease